MIEIKLDIGTTVPQALEKVRAAAEEYSEEVWADFNDTEMYSTDTEDDFYIRFTGFTKAQFEENKHKEQEERERNRREYEKRIPEIKEKYVAQFKELMGDEKLEEWNNMLDGTLQSIYREIFAECILGILRIEKNGGEDGSGKTFDEAREYIRNFGHSYNTYGIMKQIIPVLCPYGDKIVETL